MIARAYLGVILTVCIWGGNVVLLKVLLKYLPPGVINAGRLGLASVVLLLVLFASRAKVRLTAREWGALALVGLLGNSVFQLLFLGGIQRSPAGISSVVNGVVPVFVALLSPLLGARVTLRQGLGIALSLLGMLGLVLASRAPGVPITLAGLALLLLAALTWSVYTLAGRPLTERLGSLPFVALSLSLGSSPYLLSSLPDLTRSSAPTLVWLGVALSALLANVFAYQAWANGVQVLGAARTSVWNNLAPVVGLVLAFVVLGERLPLPVWPAVAVILLGVALTNWPTKSPAPGARGRVEPKAQRP